MDLELGADRAATHYRLARLSGEKPEPCGLRFDFM